MTWEIEVHEALERIAVALERIAGCVDKEYPATFRSGLFEPSDPVADLDQHENKPKTPLDKLFEAGLEVPYDEAEAVMEHFRGRVRLPDIERAEAEAVFEKAGHHLTAVERAEEIQKKLDADRGLEPEVEAVEPEPHAVHVPDRGLEPEVEQRDDVDPAHSSKFYEAPQKSSGLDQQHPAWPTDVGHCKRCGAIKINIAYTASLSKWAMTCTACNFKWERADEP